MIEAGSQRTPAHRARPGRTLSRPARRHSKRPSTLPSRRATALANGKYSLGHPLQIVHSPGDLVDAISTAGPRTGAKPWEPVILEPVSDRAREGQSPSRPSNGYCRSMPSLSACSPPAILMTTSSDRTASAVGRSSPSARTRGSSASTGMGNRRQTVVGMKGLTDEDRVKALRRFFVGLARGDDANQLSSTIADLHVRHRVFPGEVSMELAADASTSRGRHAPTRSSTATCCRGISRDRVPRQGTPSNPGRPAHTVRRSCGREPDLLDEVTYWIEQYWQDASVCSRCHRVASDCSALVFEPVDRLEGVRNDDFPSLEDVSSLGEIDLVTQKDL